jgi:hypothetical protein
VKSKERMKGKQMRNASVYGDDILEGLGRRMSGGEEKKTKMEWNGLQG